MKGYTGIITATLKQRFQSEDVELLKEHLMDYVDEAYSKLDGYYDVGFELIEDEREIE